MSEKGRDEAHRPYFRIASRGLRTRPLAQKGGVVQVSMTVNGGVQQHDVEPRTLLVQYLREDCGLTGTKIGCDTSSCGACTILLDGESVKSCTMFAAQADGGSITTIEGLAPSADELHPIQQAFHENHALAVRVLHRRDGHGGGLVPDENPTPTEREVRLGLEGNLCRCTGYHNIVQAVLAASEAHAVSVVGSRLLRREDAPILTGRARYVDDLVVHDALHARIVRSPYAHARITSIDASAAEAMRGVVGVFTGADLRDEFAAPLPCAWNVTAELVNPPHWPLAIDEACYAGDGVAVVVATSATVAEDAAGAVVVEYEALPAAVSLTDAVDGARGRAYRSREQPLLHVGADPGPRRGRRRVRERSARRARTIRAAAAHPDGDGATRRVRRARTDGRRLHRVLVHPDPAHPEGAARDRHRASPSTACASWRPPSAAASARS